MELKWIKCIYCIYIYIYIYIHTQGSKNIRFFLLNWWALGARAWLYQDSHSRHTIFNAEYFRERGAVGQHMGALSWLKRIQFLLLRIMLYVGFWILLLLVVVVVVVARRFGLMTCCRLVTKSINIYQYADFLWSSSDGYRGFQALIQRWPVSQELGTYDFPKKEHGLQKVTRLQTTTYYLGMSQSYVRPNLIFSTKSVWTWVPLGVVFPTSLGRWLKTLPPLRQSHRGGAGKGYGTMNNTWVFRVLTRFESWELDGFWMDFGLSAKNSSNSRTREGSDLGTKIEIQSSWKISENTYKQKPIESAKPHSLANLHRTLIFRSLSWVDFSWLQYFIRIFCIKAQQLS